MRSPWIRGLAAVALAAAACVGPAAAQTIDAEAAHDAASRGEITLIDVRSPAEWRDTGVPDHGLAITLHDPGGPDAFVTAVFAAVDGDRDRTIALICASGGRSHAAQALLAARGFTSVLDIGEGVLGNGRLPGWQARGLPLSPCETC